MLSNIVYPNIKSIILLDRITCLISVAHHFGIRIITWIYSDTKFIKASDLSHKNKNVHYSMTLYFGSFYPVLNYHHVSPTQNYSAAKPNLILTLDARFFEIRPIFWVYFYLYFINVSYFARKNKKQT